MTLSAVFSVEEREVLRTRLARFAEADEQISAAALLGSAARGELDQSSDIDLALRLVPGAEPEVVADAWASRVAETEQVVDQLGIRASGALYRVLLLASTLQVDLSVWPHDRPLGGGACCGLTVVVDEANCCGGRRCGTNRSNATTSSSSRRLMRWTFGSC